jgi:hypothetical protein
MVQMLCQMMWLPLSMLACSMDALAAALRAVQPPGLQDFAARYTNAPGPELPGRRSNNDNPWAQRAGATKEAKEERKMSSCNCCDNDGGMIKLIQYSIVSIKRCQEELLCQGEIIERTDMSPEAFATWVVALYIQGDLPNCRPRPLTRDDKRYLRVYHRVLEEWPRQKDDCCDDNREVTALHEIRDAILDAIGGRKKEPAPAEA